jgi:hypothetical protein
VIEHRQERWFGIPRIRHIVRCSECRSVLREIGPRLWRYAVDPLENPVIYERYNGQEIDEAVLAQLAQNPPSTTRARQPRPPSEPPSFVDSDDQ